MSSLLRYADANATGMWRRLGSPRRIPLEDVKQYAYIGVLEAIRDYDPGRGITLQSYSWLHMRRSMCDGVSALRGARAKTWQHLPLDGSFLSADQEMLRASPEPRADPLRVKSAQKAIACLDPRDVYIVTQVAKGATIKEAGAGVGLSKPWAARRRQRALRKMRRIIEEEA